MENKRNIVKIIEEICEENGYKFRAYSDNWVMKITNKNKQMFVYGYKFPNNNASSERMCDDKAIVTDILSENNIPNVTHNFFIKKTNKNILGIEQDWARLESLFYKYNQNVVVKPNDGTCGVGVLRAQTLEELKANIERLMVSNFTIALAPFEEIINEYRLIILNGELQLIFKKNRPFVIGDGISSISTLIKNKFGETYTKFDKELNLNFVPKLSEKINLRWKHNLCLGSKPEIITDQNLIDKLFEIASKTANALNAKFISVDIIETKDGYKVLEVNSGVCMDKFSSESNENYKLAKSIYAKAILNYFK